MSNKQEINIDLLINTAKSAKTLKEQKDALKDIRDAMDNVREGSGIFEILYNEANALTNQLGALNTSFEDVYGSIKPLSTQLGEIEDRLHMMALAGEQNTTEFTNLRNEAARLRQTIVDVDTEVDNLAQRGRGIQNFVGVLSGVASAFSVVQGAAALFGAENEEIEKSLLKVNAAMAIANGINEISNQLTERGTVLNKALNFVLKQNPIFIMAGIITAVAAAWAYFGNKVKSVTEIIKKQDDVLKGRITTIDKEIEKNKLLGLSIDGLRKKRTDAYNERLTLAKKELKEQEKELQETFKQYNETYVKTALLGETFGSLYQNLFGATDEEVAAVEAKLEETKQKILDIENALITDKEDIKQKEIDSEAAKIQRQIDLNKAYGRETLILEKQLLDVKMKGYTKDSDEYKDLLNQKKILDIEYSKAKEELRKEEEKTARDNYKTANDDYNNFIKENSKITTDGLNTELIQFKDLENIRDTYYRNYEENLNKYYKDEISKEEFDRLNAISFQRNLEWQLDSLKFFADAVEKIGEEIGATNKEEIDIRAENIRDLKAYLVAQSLMLNKNLEDEKQIFDVKLKLINEEMVYNKLILNQTYEDNKKAEEDKYNDTVKAYNKLKIKTDADKKQFEKAELDHKEYLKILLRNFQADMGRIEGDAQVKRVEEGKKFGKLELETLINNQQVKIDKMYENNDDILSIYEEQKKLLDLQYEKDLIDVEDNEEAKLKLQSDYSKKQIELEKKTYDEVDKIVDTSFQKRLQAYVDWFKKYQNEINSVLDSESQIMDASVDIYTNAIDKKLNKINEQKEAALELFDKELELEELRRSNADISAYQEVARREEIAQKRADIENGYLAKEKELKLKQFRAQKAADIIQSVINGAMSVSRTLAQFGVPAGIPFAVLAGVAAGAQTAVIASQPDPVFAKGGILDGPSHMNGGIKTQFGELEGGEAVINKKSTKLFAPLLSSINEFGGGVKFADSKPMTTGSVSLPNTNDNRLDRIEKMLEKFANKPILTYVNSDAVTKAQRNTSKIEKRTSF